MTQRLLSSNSSEYESDIRSQYKCHFSHTSTCAPYLQVPVEVYRGGPSLYGNWPTYMFAARANVNVSLFLPYVTCYSFVIYVLMMFACMLHRTFLTPLHNSASKTVVPPKCIRLTRDKWESIITTAYGRKQVKDYDTPFYKTLLTNCPQICQKMEVTKCFAAFIAIPKDLSCYTAQPEPTASDPKCSHILQSDMKEIVENSWILLRFNEEYYNKFRWSEIGIWICKYKFPSKEIFYHRKCRPKFT